MERAQWRQRGREPGRVAVEGRVEMLDEVDLVDVTARDRGLDALDSARVALVVPGSLPLADRELSRRRRLLVRSMDPRREQREPAGLRRVGPGRAAQRARDAVAEEDVGDEVVVLEEVARGQIGLELLKRII